MARHGMRIALATLAVLAMTGCATPAPSGDWIDFATLVPGRSSNHVLACSPDICGPAPAARPAITLGASAERVAAALASLEPGAEFRTEASGDIRARYVAVTRALRFRDDVDVLIRPVSPEQSKLAVYSRSRVGLSDFGANDARISALGQRLQTELARETGLR